jgi:hypothetical protein
VVKRTTRQKFERYTIGSLWCQTRVIGAVLKTVFQLRVSLRLIQYMGAYVIREKLVLCTVHNVSRINRNVWSGKLVP